MNTGENPVVAEEPVADEAPMAEAVAEEVPATELGLPIDHPGESLLVAEDFGEPLARTEAAPAEEQAVAEQPSDAATAAPAFVSPDDAVFFEEAELIQILKTATQSYSTTSARDVGTPDSVSIPPETSDIIEARLGNLPNVDMVVSESQHQWLSELRGSINHLPMGGVFTDRVRKEGSDFRQVVEHSGQELRARMASLGNQKPGTHVVDGTRALLQMVAHLGVGCLARIPLWNSGFWVTFKPATEDEMVELNRIIQQDRIALGRWSYGLALSNNVVYTTDRIFEFVANHVYNTSVKSDELTIEKLRDIILPQDIYSFIWGFLCSNYPSGFHYQTPCIANPEKCSHVESETLNVSKLQWTDTSTLTQKQLQHMCTMSANTMTLESVLRYQEETMSKQDRRVVINSGTKHEIAITIQTPSITAYIQQGRKWITDIVDSVNQAMTINNDDDERNKLINLRGKASTLCQYVHWIKSIEFGNITGEVDNPDDRSIAMVVDPASIMNNLASLSATDSIREGIIEAVLKYISETTMSVIGVPSYDCPVCQKTAKGDGRFPRHVSIVPLDVIQVFFALLGQRLSRIEIR